MLYECLACWLTITIYKWPKCNLSHEHILEGDMSVQKEIIFLCSKKGNFKIKWTRNFQFKNAFDSRKASYEDLSEKASLCVSSISNVQHRLFWITPLIFILVHKYTIPLSQGLGLNYVLWDFTDLIDTFWEMCMIYQ